MWYYYRAYRQHSRLWHRVWCLLLGAAGLGIFCSLVTTWMSDGIDYADSLDPSSIFCVVLSANERHRTFAPAILYSWGKRCDRFYFVTRLQNTSLDLMMLEKFENITDVSPTTITQQTLEVLVHLQQQPPFTHYQWFLRGSDESFVIVPNLRRLIRQLQLQYRAQPVAYVGDVEELYKSRRIMTSGSVMLFNRYALERLATSQNFNVAQDQCLADMIYDHEFVKCMRLLDIRINPLNDKLIRSQNLSFYKMDNQLKDTCCSSDTVAFRSSNETDMYKFDFLYHRLDAHSRITI